MDGEAAAAVAERGAPRRETARQQSPVDGPLLAVAEVVVLELCAVPGECLLLGAFKKLSSPQRARDYGLNRSLSARIVYRCATRGTRDPAQLFFSTVLARFL